MGQLLHATTMTPDDSEDYLSSTGQKMIGQKPVTRNMIQEAGAQYFCRTACPAFMLQAVTAQHSCWSRRVITLLLPRAHIRVDLLDGVAISQIDIQPEDHASVWPVTLHCIR